MQEALLLQYIASLKDKIKRIDSLSTKFAEGNNKASDNIRLLAHTLHGSGASFGFPEISEAGKAVEFADQDELADKLLSLKTVLEQVVANNPAKVAVADTESAALAQQESRVADARQADDTNATGDVLAETIKILLVDDDMVLANGLEEILSGLPGKQEVIKVGSGIKAQEAIVKQAFDLIVMDLLLPDLDGRELIEQIKQEFQIKTPLLVLSSLQKDSVRIECMALGADKYLTKPFYEDVVLEEAKNLLGKKVKQKLRLVPLEGESVIEEDEEKGKVRHAYLEGKNILIAEDDKMQATLIKQRLAEEGAKVEHASNGREAMQLLRSREFSLLILDVKMPVMDGFEVLERIRGELALTMPVIMVTALGKEEDIIRGYDLGATDYILKPFSEVQLLARVKSLLRSRKN